jgi:hypothetical protein
MDREGARREKGSGAREEDRFLSQMRWGKMGSENGVSEKMKMGSVPAF